MTELQVVEWLRRITPATGSGVVLGMGDDCAVFHPRGSSEDLLLTTDQLIEGVHFRKSDSPESIGHRALGRGLSDIAAMGGSPRFCLVSLSRPRAVPDAWLRGFYRGLLRLAARFGTILAGGDLASGRMLACDVMVCGAVRRSLALDLHRMCLASRLSARLEEIPLAVGATLEHALSGGDEYELLYTAPADAPVAGIPIGFMEPGAAGSILFSGGVIEPSGYDHFRSD